MKTASLPSYFNMNLLRNIKSDIIEKLDLEKIINFIRYDDIDIDFISQLNIDDIYIGEYDLPDFHIPNSKLKIYIKNIRKDVGAYLEIINVDEYKIYISLAIVCIDIYNRDYSRLSKLLSHELTHLYDFENQDMSEGFERRYSRGGDIYFSSRAEIGAKISELISELYDEYIINERFRDLYDLLSQSMNLILNTFDEYLNFKKYLNKIKSDKRRRYAERIYKLRLLEYFSELLFILKEYKEKKFNKKVLIKKINYINKKDIVEE